jgi:hypothetical protein
MFAVPIDFGIQAVKVRTKNVDGRQVRSCRVVLSHEFDDELAAALGPKAKHILKGMEDGEIESATLPIDGLAAIGAFSSPGNKKNAVRVPYMRGTKARAKAGGKEEEPPTLRLEFEFAWNKDAWVFLGEHCSAIASVVLTQTQLALAATDEATN